MDKQTFLNFLRPTMIIEEILNLDHLRGWSGQPRIFLHVHFLAGAHGSAFLWLSEENKVEQTQHFDAVALALHVDTDDRKSQMTSSKLLGDDIEDMSQKLARLLGTSFRDWAVGKRKANLSFDL